MKKKTWFAAACAAILLVLILIVLLLIGKRQGKPTTVDPDSEYPYTVRQTKQGLLITISKGAEGYSWNAATDDPYAVFTIEKTKSVQKSEILLCPVSDGIANATVTLERNEIPYDVAYQLSVLVQCEGKTVEILDAQHRSYAGTVMDAEGRYAVYSMADGSYLLCMEKSAESDWTASLESGSADVRWYQPDWMYEQQDVSENGEHTAQEAWFQIKDNGRDSAVIFVTDRKQGNVLVLNFVHDPDGVFLLDTSEMRSVTELSDEIAESAAWNLPVGAALLEYGSTELFSQENGKAFRADTALFFMEGTSWELLRAEGQTRKALSLRDYRMSDEVSNGDVSAEIELDTLWMYKVDEQWHCAWDSENAAYLLKGHDTDRDTLEAVAGILLVQQP